MLYGDWGTSKAYVLGIAFALAGYSSLPLLLAMAALTALVGLNYYFVCSLYPDGGGVYSALRGRSRLFASVGALLLIADYLVTASLSVLEGFNYFSHLLVTITGSPLPNPPIWAIGLLLTLGALNWFGPKHSGTFAVALAIPASLAALSIGLLAIPHLGDAHVEPSNLSLGARWGLFAGIVLALSGVEAVSNMTGVMVADPKPDRHGHQTVKRTAAWTIGVVATEVVVLTVVLSFAMHSIPPSVISPEHTEAMLGQMAKHFGVSAMGATLGAAYSVVVGLVMALLLFSAGNTAIVGMISVFYMMAKDRELPAPFEKLNFHGVPTLPLACAAALPCILLMIVSDVEGLAHLYAIGVVGAITMNLGGCATNRELEMRLPTRLFMGATAVVMLAIWVTIAIEKHEALVFAVVLLALGLLARSFVQERRQVAAERTLREALQGTDEEAPVRDDEARVLVALRGMTETFAFALDEAKMRGGRLGVLFVREVNVIIPQMNAAQEDDDAMKIARDAAAAAAEAGVPFEFIYKQGDDAAQAILDGAREWHADYLIIGATAQGAIAKLLRGSVVNTVAEFLPRRTRLIIYSWRPKSMPARVMAS